MEPLNRSLIDDLCDYSKSLLVDGHMSVYFIAPEKTKARANLKYLQDTLHSGENVAFLVLAQVTGIDPTILPALEQYNSLMMQNLKVLTMIKSHISTYYDSKEKQQMDFQELSLECPLFYPEVKIEFFLILGTWMNTEQNPKILFKMRQKEII